VDAEFVGQPGADLLVPGERLGRAPAGGEQCDQPGQCGLVEGFPADVVGQRSQRRLGLPGTQGGVGVRQDGRPHRLVERPQQRFGAVHDVEVGEQPAPAQRDRGAEQGPPLDRVVASVGSGHQFPQA
jgi:hypothetical protein